MTTTKETLEVRGKEYGEFHNQAHIAQNLKYVMRETKNWDSLSNPHKECLEMIVHKIARILNGNPNYIDSVRDIAGYAELLVEVLQETEGATDVRQTKVKKSSGSWANYP